jgi:hypothetical protein
MNDCENFFDSEPVKMEASNEDFGNPPTHRRADKETTASESLSSS